MLITHFCLHYSKRGRGGSGGGFTRLNGGGSLHHKIRPHFLTSVMLRTAIITKSKKNQQQQQLVIIV